MIPCKMYEQIEIDKDSFFGIIGIANNCGNCVNWDWYGQECVVVGKVLSEDTKGVEWIDMG